MHRLRQMSAFTFCPTRPGNFIASQAHRDCIRSPRPRYFLQWRNFRRLFPFLALRYLERNLLVLLQALDPLP